MTELTLAPYWPRSYPHRDSIALCFDFHEHGSNLQRNSSFPSFWDNLG